MNKLLNKKGRNRVMSALLSFVLAISLLVSTFTGLAANPQATGSVEAWDGTVASAFEKGSGTKESPYLVSTPAELLLAVTSTGVDENGNQLYYKMVNDIYVNDVSDPAWKSDAKANQWAVVSTSEEAKETAFGGVFNGNGYKVFGLFVDKTYEAPTEGELDLAVATGLFPTVKDSAKISAVGIENSYFSLKNTTAEAGKAYSGYVGLIVGYAYLESASNPIVIDRCYSSADCYTAGVYCGLVAGLSSQTYNALKVSNCYSTTTAGGFHSGVNGNRFILVSGGTTAAAAVMEYTFSNSGLSYTGCNSTSKANYCCNWVSGNGFAKKIPLADMQGEKAFEKMVNLNAENAYRLTDTFPVLRVFDRTETGEKIWDGTFSAPTVGTGEETNPLIISTPEELAWVIKNGGENKFYRLEADIYLNDVTKINWQTGEVTAGYTPNSWVNSTEAPDFKGTIDGNGHVVYGLYYKNLGTSVWEFTGTALIPYVKEGSSATLKNLGLDNVYINNTKNAGGLFGGNAKGAVAADQCYVGESVTLKGHLAGALVGASSGRFNLSNCYSLATVSTHTTASDSYYGLVGDFYGNRAESSTVNCYNAKGPFSTKDSGPATRENIFAIEKIDVHTYVTVVSAENMQGLDALTNEAKLKGLGDKFIATTTYPILKCFTKVEYSQHWDGVSMYAPIKGEGTKDAPFEISNAPELAYVIKNGGGEGVYYKLTADIYLNDLDKIDWATGTANEKYKINEWFTSREMSGFAGSIEGDGHVIYGLYINKAGDKAWQNFTSAAGLIANAGYEQVDIMNLGIDYAFVKHPNTAGLFIGMGAMGEFTFNSCFTGENTYVSSYDSGAFVGCLSGAASITGCYSFTHFDENTHLYGFMGDFYRSPSYNGGKSTSIVGSYAVNGPIATKTQNGIKNCYDAVTENSNTTVKLTAENMQGLDALSNGDKMVMLSIYRLYQATEGYPVLRVFLENPEPLPEEEEETVWNGNLATFFAEGSGTATDPYIITKGSELALMVESGGNGAYYKLKNDIYLNDVSETTWYKSEDNKAWLTDTVWSGHLDGDGHCVYGMWYPQDNTNTTSGLIPVFASGSIKNIGVRYSYIFADKYAGGLVGKTKTGGQKVISTSFTDDTVQVGYTGNGDYGAGGLIGYADSDISTTQVRVLIENCYSKALIEGASSDRTNGLIGTVWKSAVKVVNSYSVNAAPYYMAGHGTISALYWDYSKEERYTDGAEGLVPINEIINGVYADKGTIRHGNNYTILEESFLRGEAAKKGFAKFDFEKVWKIAEKGTPTLKIFGLKGDDVDVSEDGVTYAGGTGRKNDPYIIETVAQLRYLVTSSNTEGKYYKLANDLYINDTSKKNWKQNSPAVWYSYGAYQGPVFKGNFDGDGHYIYGLYIADTPETGESIVNGAAGLFPNAAAGCEIRNLHLRDSYVSGKAYTGAFVGYTTSPAEGKFVTIIGCSADASVTVRGQTAGGLVGGGGTLTQFQYVYFTGKVEATSEGRGNAFVGDVWKNGQRIYNAYSVDYTNYRSGFYPQISTAVYSNVAQTKTTLTAKDQMYGAAAKSEMPELDWNIWYTVGRKMPHLKVITDDMIVGFSAEGEKGKVWSGLVATKYAGGNGTADDPYIIETPEQFAFLINDSATTGKYYKLTADIKLNNTSKKGWEARAREWITTNNVFKGHFDGDGHVVTGLYYNTTNSVAGLFPRVGEGAVIEKVGVVNATIINNADGREAYAAAIIGHITGNNATDSVETFVNPTLRQCFADDTVYVEAGFAGGLIGGNNRAIDMFDCYFTGELTGSVYAATLVGNTWNSYESHIVNTYAVDPDRNAPTANGTSNFVYTGCYVDGNTTRIAVAPNAISISAIKGNKATETMTEFDFAKVWKTVENGTPVLRCFKNAEQYTSHRDPRKVTISFATEGGDRLEPVTGFMGDKIPEFPVPTRYGYLFDKWYVNEHKVIEFGLETFPANDVILYASWEKYGLEFGFESGVLDPLYDWNEGAELYQPGVAGYNPKHVYAGMRVMRTKPDSESDGLFLINYTYPLEVGKVYDVNFYLQYIGGEGQIDFLHAEHPQVDSPMAGYQKVLETSELKTGEWMQIKTKITANAPYIVIRVSAGCELYFDNFQIVPTGETGDVGKLEGFSPDTVTTEPLQEEEGGENNNNMTLWIIVGAVGGVIILLGAVVTVVLVIKSKRKKEKPSDL